MPRKSGSKDGKFYVGDDPRMCETQAMATSFAQTLCQRAPDGTTMYVREVGVQGVLVQVSKIGRDIVTRRVR